MTENKRPSPLKKMYLVPNLVTTLSLFSGFYSLLQSVEGQFLNAAWAILAAGIFDSLDGRIARLAKVTSEFGVQYDSLSDLVSFGVAPAFLLYRSGLFAYGRLGIGISFFFLACAALRLARFNIGVGILSKKFFQGLSTTLAGQTVVGWIWFETQFLVPLGVDPEGLRGVRLFLAPVLSLLMVSTLPYPSFKEVNWRSRATLGLLLWGIGGFLLLVLRPEVGWFVLCSSYVFGNLIFLGIRSSWLWLRGTP